MRRSVFGAPYFIASLPAGRYILLSQYENLVMKNILNILLILVNCFSAFAWDFTLDNESIPVIFDSIPCQIS